MYDVEEEWCDVYWVVWELGEEGYDLVEGWIVLVLDGSCCCVFGKFLVFWFGYV